MSGFEHISPGDKWQPSSIEINAMKDVARAYQGGAGISAPGTQISSQTFGPVLIRVRNSTANNRDRYTVCSLGEPRWALDSDFRIETAIFDVVPWDSSLATVVLQDPLKTNEIGRACISGPTLARINGNGNAAGRQAIASTTTGVMQETPGGAIHYFYPRPVGGGVILLNLGAFIPFVNLNSTIVKTPPSGIGARSGGPTTYTPGSAFCQFVGFLGSNLLVGSTQTTVFNYSTTVIGGDELVEVHNMQGRWITGCCPSSGEGPPPI